jgi:hypothetical protein
MTETQRNAFYDRVKSNLTELKSKFKDVKMILADFNTEFYSTMLDDIVVTNPDGTTTNVPVLFPNCETMDFFDALGSLVVLDAAFTQELNNINKIVG